MLSIKISDFAILNINDVVYPYIITRVIKKEAVNLLKNLIKQKEAKYHKI